MPFLMHICAKFNLLLLFLELCKSVSADLITISASDLDLDPDSFRSVDPNLGRKFRSLLKLSNFVFLKAGCSLWGGGGRLEASPVAL